MVVSPIVKETESSALGLPFKIATIIFFAVLLIALPSFAIREEQAYRKGYIEQKKMIIQSIKFGLIHLTMGIPLAAALAIIPSGYFYALKYKKAYFHSLDKIDDKKICEDTAAMSTSVYHTMYNTVLIVFMMFVLIFKTL